MSILRFGALGALMVFFCACTNDDNGIPAKKDASPIQLDSNGGPNGPEVRVRVYSPDHLLSNVPSKIWIVLRVSHRTSRDVSYNRVVKATAISNWTTKATIPGKWSTSGNLTDPYDAIFTPSSPLPVGEYLIEITGSSDLEVSGNVQTLFHVGALPRVREFRFTSSVGKPGGKPGPIDVIEPIFSELMDLSNLSENLVVEKSVNSIWTVSSFKTGGTTLASALSATDEIRVTVKKGLMSKTNLALDGLYKGIPGSGDFVATFKYKDIDLGTMIWTPKVP